MSEFRDGNDIFACRQCGECCKGFGGTYVSPEDVLAIARYITADPESFVDEYCAMSGSRPVLKTGPDGACVFFDPERQCTIHPVKPFMCRAWPFIRTVVTNPENWDAMAGSCPGMVRGVPFDRLRDIVSSELTKRSPGN